MKQTSLTTIYTNDVLPDECVKHNCRLQPIVYKQAQQLSRLAALLGQRSEPDTQAKQSYEPLLEAYQAQCDDLLSRVRVAEEHIDRLQIEVKRLRQINKGTQHIKQLFEEHCENHTKLLQRYSHLVELICVQDAFTMELTKDHLACPWQHIEIESVASSPMSLIVEEDRARSVDYRALKALLEKEREEKLRLQDALDAVMNPTAQPAVIEFGNAQVFDYSKP